MSFKPHKCPHAAGKHNPHHGDEELFLSSVSTSRNSARLHPSAPYN